MLFLNERDGLRTIREMLGKTDAATIVVAFWGAGAIDSLGLRKQWQSLRVVCNLDSGACNPSEIEEIMGLGANVEVRSDPRLHGKVYLTAAQVVLGSSNASSNGLVVEGPAISGWAEANITTTDSGLLAQLRTWCDERFLTADAITPEKIELAHVAWKARRAASPAAGGLSTDLLSSVRSQPDHPAFARIKVVQWARTVSSHAERVHKQAIEEDQSLTGTDIYEGWGNAMRVGDWLVDFDVSGQQASFTGYWHVAHRDNENDLTFVRKRTSVEIPTIGKLKISNLDRARLEKMIGTIPGKLLGPAEKITPIAQVVSSLDNWAPVPSIKAFDRAMFAIYDQAASFGYYPHDFRSMVEKLGGVPAARQLINTVKVSQGFTRLWEEKRLDLSVEALAVSPQWRALFTVEEIKRSRRRLKEVGYPLPD
ncbi:phospholipase D family protein [Rhizobium leguminosarum]|uniref:phospholipase D family protein n=1 Tax=Rhizobium leguminosarum TaxID=384 RepID=UPI0013F14DEB|nr:phospholipase D family protein [Rhizobium leguminosarum]